MTALDEECEPSPYVVVVDLPAVAVHGPLPQRRGFLPGQAVLTAYVDVKAELGVSGEGLLLPQG